MRSLLNFKRSATIVAMLVLGVLTAASVALADNIKNQVAAGGGVGGNTEVVEGGSVTIPYYVQATGSDGCDAADGSALTVTINVPSGLTISKPDGSALGGLGDNQLTFNSCGDADTNAQSVKFTPAGPAGTVYTIPAVSWSDTSGTYGEAATAFKITMVSAGGGGGGGGTTPDTSPPSISYTLDPAAPDGNNGWYKNPVTIDWTVTDLESAVTILSGCVDQTVNTNGEHTLGCSAESEGGSASDSASFKIDQAPPTVGVTGVDGGPYTIGSLPTPGCSTEDQTGLSGVATSATVSSVTGGTSNGVGDFEVTCSGAEDNAGNAAGDALGSYHVNYSADPIKILQPINSDNTSIFSRGRAVPVKFQLPGDEYTGYDMSGWSLKRQPVSCSTGFDSGDAVPENVTVNPSNSFRYDSSADQYVNNASFKDLAVGTCWRVVVTLDSGETATSAAFKLTK